MNRVEIVNGPAWERAVRESVEALVKQAGSDLLVLGLRVQNEARALCPVDTGRLRSSIQVDGPFTDARGEYVTVGTNVDYAPHVEYGTRTNRAQPFLRPALVSVAGRAR